MMLPALTEMEISSDHNVFNENVFPPDFPGHIAKDRQQPKSHWLLPVSFN